MKYLSKVKVALLAVSAFSVLAYFVGLLSDVDMMLRWAYVLLAVAVLATVLLPLLAIAKNPKSAVRTLIGLAIVAVVVVVAFALASDAPVVNSAGGFFEDKLTLKLSDTGLYATYAAFVVAIVTIIGGEIIRIFK